MSTTLTLMTNRSGFTGQRVKPLLDLPKSLLRGFEEALLAKVTVIITPLKESHYTQSYEKRGRLTFLSSVISIAILAALPPISYLPNTSLIIRKSQGAKVPERIIDHQVPKGSYLLVPSWPQRIKMVQKGRFPRFVNLHFFAIVHVF